MATDDDAAVVTLLAEALVARTKPARHIAFDADFLLGLLPTGLGFLGHPQLPRMYDSLEDVLIGRASLHHLLIGSVGLLATVEEPVELSVG